MPLKATTFRDCCRTLLSEFCTATIVGIVLNIIGVNPVDMLFVSAVINGFTIIPILFLLNHVSTWHLKIHREGFKILLAFSWLFFAETILCLVLYLQANG